MWKYEETPNFGFFPWPETFHYVLYIPKLLKYHKTSEKIIKDFQISVIELLRFKKSSYQVLNP